MFNLKIDITKIRYFLKMKNTLDRQDFIWDGNWDKKKLKLSKYRKYNINYNSMFQIYKEKKDYIECDEFRIKSKQILLGKKTPRGNNLTELKKYFKSLDKLKNSLNKFGYKSQQNLKNKNKNDEIGVVIGRNGEIIKLEDNFGGTHRFALCKILKIKKIIVSVKAVHKALLKKSDIERIVSKNNKIQLLKILKKKINF
tara:strand:+ start:2219 stop:2812 length:594 start_codon:yes stop_codon:yes gene_type:complete